MKNQIIGKCTGDNCGQLQAITKAFDWCLSCGAPLEPVSDKLPFEETNLTKLNGAQLVPIAKEELREALQVPTFEELEGYAFFELIKRFSIIAHSVNQLLNNTEKQNHESQGF